MGFQENRDIQVYGNFSNFCNKIFYRKQKNLTTKRKKIWFGGIMTKIVPTDNYNEHIMIDEDLVPFSMLRFQLTYL